MIGKNHDRDRIEEALRGPLNPDRVSKRRGPGGTTLTYVAWHERTREMNDAAGLLWSSVIVDHNVQVFEGERLDRRTGEAVPCYDAVASAKVRASVGPFDAPWCVREGIGYGSAEAQPTRGQAYELAGKAAASDALSRALCLFGERTGLALYVVSERERDERGLVAAPPAPFAPPVEQAKIAEPKPKPEPEPEPEEAAEAAAEDAAERAAIQAQAEEPAPTKRPAGRTYGTPPALEEVDPELLACLADADRAQLLAASAAGEDAVARLGREVWGACKAETGSQAKTKAAFKAAGWSGTGSPTVGVLARIMAQLHALSSAEKE